MNEKIICPTCKECRLDPISEEELAERIAETDEDYVYDCDFCIVDVLIGSGWDVSLFQDHIPYFLEEPDLRDYIFYRCDIADKRWPIAQKWRAGKITEEERNRQFAIIEGKELTYDNPKIQAFAEFAKANRIIEG